LVGLGLYLIGNITVKILRAFNIWANSNRLPPKVGKLDRYLLSRMLQLEALEGRITPATYTVFTNLDAGTGSLRQAITNANNNAGPDIIDFAITGGTVSIQTITLDTALPLITDQVTIDGTTQSGYSANTLSVGGGNNAAIKIQLDGSKFTAASGIVGLYFNTLGSSVSGLSFVNFPFAIYANNNNITIKGNYFGVNADGSAQSNGLSGVGVDIATVNAAIVGGNTVADQNVFGNLTTGIVQIAGSGSSFTGNRIGLGKTNTSFMPNTTGIQINNNANVDALNHSISANLIGKNTTGIKLIGLQGGTGTVTGTQIVGNLIGTDSSGSTNNLGNSGDAISIDDGVINTTIGNSVKPNTIAYSNQNGVFINGAASVGNTIQNNNIRNNLGLGILLLNGANSNIASPVLTQQLSNGSGGFTYSGFVNGVANTQYTVDFYSSLISDSRSQGANYLGSTTVTTDASGNIGFTGFAPTQNQTSQGATYVVTATATNVGIGTSVFSAGPPAQISVVSGSSQTTLVGTAFANPLTAKVVDSRGDPVPNIQVQFAAPNSNPPTNPATGTFPVNQQTIIAITGVTGEAASTTLTANNAPGNFIVLSSVVGNPGITNASFALTNTPLAPTITSFTPTSGQVGTSVVISGSGFIGTTVVRFNGITSTNVVVNSATQITATVPTGATTGLISVTTPGGTVATTTNFTVTPSFAVTYSVTNTLDSGLGSLRQAINDANATAGNDIINFNFATGPGPYKITLNSSLPNILAASSSGSLTITGLGATSLTIDANKNNFRIFSIDSGGNLSISGVTVTGANITGNGGAFNNSGILTISNSILSGNSGDSGGAIYSGNVSTLTVNNSTISGNLANNGGGIFNASTLTLTVNNSTISSNLANDAGGGIFFDRTGTFTVTNSTLSGNNANRGGAIANSGSGTLTVSNSTISGNTTINGAGIYNTGGSNLTVINSTLSANTATYGGGILNNFGGILSVSNSTFSGNTASKGGGIFSDNNLTVTNSTLSGNSAAVSGGGIFSNGGNLNIANTIIANSTSGGDYAGTGTVTLISPATAASNLVTQAGLLWATTKTTTEINLGPLQNNGGPTSTMALGVGSAAIGAGNATISNAAPINGLDQRGYVRSSTAPSIGAFDLPTITSFTPTSGPTGTSVVISGSGFVGTTVVRFNGITATNVVVNSATQITAMAPAGATTGPISVTTLGGTVTTTTNFTNTSNIVSSFKVELANPGQQIFAGVPVSVTITALNSTGGVDSNFVGFVNISTTDSSATIPANVAFVAGDNGVVAITAIFRTLGPVTVTANFNGNATGSGSGIVLQGSNEPFQVSSPSAPVPFPLGVSITKDLAFLTGVTSATISEYVATIVWGDGSQNSAGTFTPSPNQPGVFQVLGTHTYSSLELFSGSVTVTRISDNTSSSSSFNAEVLTASQKNNLNGASGAILPPGGRTADARVNGFNSFYKQSANNSSSVILFTASYFSNPQPYTTTVPAQSFFDVRLRNPEPGALLTLTASFSGGLQRNSSPYLQFAQDTSTSYENVVSANNLVIINYIDSTITVYLDQSSFPLINNLRGTVFAVVTNTTQVSSNTITIMPAAFTGGTAVGIAWGSSSTLVDVSSSANASNTSLTFQNSRQTTLSLAPSQSKGTVILRTVNNGGTTNDDASKETVKQLINPDIIQKLIRGTIGIGPEVIGGMIKKMLPENAGDFLKEWSKVISEIKAIPNDMITPKVNAIPQTNNGSSTDNPEECDDSFLEDAAFDDISKISSTMGLVDESTPCLNEVSPDSMLEELAFCGEINWAGLALSTLTLSQFRTFSKDKPKRVRPIKVGA